MPKKNYMGYAHPQSGAKEKIHVPKKKKGLKPHVLHAVGKEPRVIYLAQKIHGKYQNKKFIRKGGAQMGSGFFSNLFGGIASAVGATGFFITPLLPITSAISATFAAASGISALAGKGHKKGGRRRAVNFIHI